METDNYVNEEWRPVSGYEGLYEVSNFGRVKSLPRNGTINRERIIKPGLFKKYLGVSLNKNNKRTSHLVHRLVAIAFIPNPNSLPQVNHKNEDRLDNRVENLEWCDRQYNINYGTGVERRAIQRRKKIMKLSMDGETICVYNSLTEASNDCNVGIGNISSCCHNKKNYKSAGGFKWKYAD